jgi:hypothetical protein
MRSGAVDVQGVLPFTDSKILTGGSILALLALLARPWAKTFALVWSNT